MKTPTPKPFGLIIIAIGIGGLILGGAAVVLKVLDERRIARTPIDTLEWLWVQSPPPPIETPRPGNEPIQSGWQIFGPGVSE